MEEEGGSVMADPYRAEVYGPGGLKTVLVGSHLKIDCRVTGLRHLTDPEFPVTVETPAGQPLTLHADDVSAAEHTPPPKVFKRGDWVSMGFGRRSARKNGLVLRVEKRTLEGVGARLEVQVNWPDGSTYWYVPNDLEPDTAPEE